MTHIGEPLSGFTSCDDHAALWQFRVDSCNSGPAATPRELYPVPTRKQGRQITTGTIPN